MKDNMKINGIIEIFNMEDEKVLDYYRFNNLITNNGFIYIQKMIGGDLSGYINKLALGGSVTPTPSISDTQLGSKIILLDVKRDYSTVKELKFIATIAENTFTVTKTYNEAGLVYKTSTEETLLTRVVFPIPIYQKSTNSLSIIYSLIFG